MGDSYHLYAGGRARSANGFKGAAARGACFSNTLSRARPMSYNVLSYVMLSCFACSVYFIVDSNKFLHDDGGTNKYTAKTTCTHISLYTHNCMYRCVLVVLSCLLSMFVVLRVK